MHTRQTTRTVTRSRILGRTLGRAGVAVTALLALAAPLTPAGAAGTTDARASDQSHTRVVVHLPGCEGCAVALASDTDEAAHAWSKPAKTVADGTVAFWAPTWRTRGLSVSVTEPDASDADTDDAAPGTTLVAMRYGQERVGGLVGRRAAAGKHRATACFAGTAAGRLDLRVRSSHLRVPSADGDGRVRVLRAWSARTQPWTGAMQHARRGYLASQAVPECG
ncbi:hypothetical protein [Nocardioides bruguierae]|uniref:hypothetical protein n=1 Tax=Nocardioides bruguierae TaxID=2945102 RepID=UPI0020206863|nr:hypothetical protein [Nocardioides bruguierae]MCL8026396.1 hypothetical protein [Nocardioides bruguierae]